MVLGCRSAGVAHARSIYLLRIYLQQIFVKRAGCNRRKGPGLKPQYFALVFAGLKPCANPKKQKQRQQQKQRQRQQQQQKQRKKAKATAKSKSNGKKQKQRQKAKPTTKSTRNRK